MLFLVENLIKSDQSACSSDNEDLYSPDKTHTAGINNLTKVLSIDRHCWLSNCCGSGSATSESAHLWWRDHSALKCNWGCSIMFVWCAQKSMTLQRGISRHARVAMYYAAVNTCQRAVKSWQCDSSVVLCLSGTKWPELIKYTRSTCVLYHTAWWPFCVLFSSHSRRCEL